MLACALQLTFAPGFLPASLTLLAFGIASGAAMDPLHHHQGSQSGQRQGQRHRRHQFCRLSALPPWSDRCPPASSGKTVGTAAIDPQTHFFQSTLFWVLILVGALLVSSVPEGNRKGRRQGHARTDKEGRRRIGAAPRNVEFDHGAFTRGTGHPELPSQFGCTLPHASQAPVALLLPLVDAPVRYPDAVVAYGHDQRRAARSR